MEVLPLHAWTEAASRLPDGIPKHVTAGVLDLIERLPPPDVLGQGDLHSSNVVRTAEGPRITDWGAGPRARRL